MKVGLRRSATVALLLGFGGFLGFATSLGIPRGASALGPAALQCGHATVVHDYLQPLTKMAPIRKPPRLGELPFAPEGLRFEASGESLVAGSGQLGFSLRNGASHLRHLNWTVETKLARVNAKGEIVSSLGAKRRNLRSIEVGHVDEFLRWVSGKPAFYRVDIAFFRRGTQEPLGEYSAYGRVVRPKIDLRLIVETPNVSPGELATAKLVNLGTLPFVTSSYEYGVGMQAFTGEKWIRVPDSPPRRSPKSLRPTTLPAGMENRGCLRYLVPSDQPPGLFRFITYQAPGEDSVLSAQFEVRS
jgi:hypothetical protein